MLSFSPFLPSNLEWENNRPSTSSNPTNFRDDNNNNNNNCSCTLSSDYNLGHIFSPSFQTLRGDYNLDFQNSNSYHEGEYHLDDHKKQPADDPVGLGLGLEESAREQQKKSANSAHDGEFSALAKKLNHNARERHRRKRMNVSYSALRSLLPAPLHQREELSIPETVSLVVDYIPQLQKEVQNLIHMKEELLSKISSVQGVKRELKRPREKETRSETSISVRKLGEREIVVHISTYERVSLPAVLLLLENYGLLVLNVSCFECFGGRTFRNIHLWIEEGACNIAKCETLHEELQAMFEKGNLQANVLSRTLLPNKEEPRSDPIKLSPYKTPWIYQPEWVGFYLKESPQ